MEWLPHIWRKYEDLAKQVAQEMRDLGEESKTSDYELLRDPWEEYALQIQDAASALFEAYELTIEQIISQKLEIFAAYDIAVLWIGTDGALLAGDEIPCRDEMEEAIVDKLKSEVASLAANEDLSHFYAWRYAEELKEYDEDEEHDSDGEDESSDEAPADSPAPPTTVDAETVHADQSTFQPQLFE